MESVSLPRLRVGIFADSALQPGWIVEALAKAGGSGFAEITLVSDTVAAPRKLVRDANHPPLLWRAYAGADRAFSRGQRARGRTDVRQLVPLERRLARADGERCWRARLADARLDVAFVLGDVDAAAIEGVARHGLWRFCFGDAHGTCEALAGVHEAIEDKPVMVSGIRIHRPGKPDRVACQSWARTFLSVTKSRATLFAKTGELLARALRDLHAGGASWIEHGTEPAQADALESFPDTGNLIRGLSRLSTRVVRRATEKALTVDQWSIAFRFDAGEAWSGSLDGFFRLDPPKGWFWADPFPIERDGRFYIFFEELPLGAAKAHISVVEVDRAGRASAPAKVLERDYHLSYPFLVEEQGTLYMIPETALNHTVEIYRCADFPFKWVLERVLLKDVFCADATLHREDGRWWMFANAAVPGAEINDELHLYSSPTLLGDWQPHRRNPVKSDVRSSRPAGRLFRRGGGLYRPGQICTPLYGAGIALHRVTTLTPDEYAEEEEARIVPSDTGTLGIHTLNRAGDLTVTDAFERRPRF